MDNRLHTLIALSPAAYSELRQALDDAGVLIVCTGNFKAEVLGLRGVLVTEDPDKAHARPRQELPVTR